VNFAISSTGSAKLTVSQPYSIAPAISAASSAANRTLKSAPDQVRCKLATESDSSNTAGKIILTHQLRSAKLAASPLCDFKIPAHYSPLVYIAGLVTDVDYLLRPMIFLITQLQLHPPVFSLVRRSFVCIKRFAGPKTNSSQSGRVNTFRQKVVFYIIGTGF